MGGNGSRLFFSRSPLEKSASFPVCNSGLCCVLRLSPLIAENTVLLSCSVEVFLSLLIFPLLPASALVTMSTGPFPAPGKWSNKKSKEEIFSHLAEHGIHSAEANHLLDFEESKTLAKNDGLMLIEAMHLVIADVNVLTSTWELVVEFYWRQFASQLETPEPPDIRITLILRWIEFALTTLNSTRAAGGGADAPIALDGFECTRITY